MRGLSSSHAHDKFAVHRYAGRDLTLVGLHVLFNCSLLDPALKENVSYTYRVLREDDGALRWVQAFGEAQFSEVDGEERAVLYVGTLQDVTDHKLAEEKLVQSEARQRLAIESGDMAVWEVDLRDNSIVGSPELNRLYGFPPDAKPTIEEFRARNAPGERERVLQEGEAAQASGQDKLQTVIHQVRPDGTEKWLLMRAHIVPNAFGGGQRVLGVLIDVTENRRREERLATLAQELKHRLLNAYSVMGVIAKRAWMDTEDPATALAEFQTRLESMGRVTKLLFANEGATTSLPDLMQAILAPYRSVSDDRFALHGQDGHRPYSAEGKPTIADVAVITTTGNVGSMAGTRARRSSPSWPLVVSRA